MEKHENPIALTWWLTGQPGAGKTTLANALAARLSLQHHPVCVLDGDEIRKGLLADLGFGFVAPLRNPTLFKDERDPLHP